MLQVQVQKLTTYPDVMYKVAYDAILIQIRCVQSVVSLEKNLFNIEEWLNQVPRTNNDSLTSLIEIFSQMYIIHVEELGISNLFDSEIQI